MRSPIERMIDEACGVPSDFRGTPVGCEPRPIHKSGDWVFYGEYDPGNHPGCVPKSTTFSVGVFQLVSKSRGKGLKRGPVVKRFTGRTADPEEVYGRVLRFIAGQTPTPEATR